MRIFSYLSQFMIFFFVKILVPFYSHLSSFDILPPPNLAVGVRIFATHNNLSLD